MKRCICLISILFLLSHCVRGQCVFFDSICISRNQFTIGDEIIVRPYFVYDDNKCGNFAVNIPDTIAGYINANPTYIFAIEDHTDCRASAEYNRALSQRRADTMRLQVLHLLTDTAQLPVAIGKGEDELFIKKCQCDLSDYKHACTEAEHQMNRRTVLRVIGKRKE